MISNRILVSTIVAVMLCQHLLAQRTARVGATYTYTTSEDVSPAKAKEIALLRAQNEAIANEFGTLINQSNTTRITNRNGASNVDFYSLSSSDVKGEWLETIGTPKYDISFDRGMQIITVTVEGRAREIVSAAVDLQVKLMRTLGNGRKVASNDFQNGDDLFLQFSSPLNGYLAVYLLDKENAYCLLPYMRDAKGRVSVQANQQYLFFSPKDAGAEEKDIVDEYTMTCEQEDEENKVYIIFSPNMFSKANDQKGDIRNNLELPRQLSFENFNKWLTKNRRHDSQMTVVMETINIKK